VIWGILRNPAYVGRAVFGKTMVAHESPGLNRVARLQGRSTPRASKTVDRPRGQGPAPAHAPTDRHKYPHRRHPGHEPAVPRQLTQHPTPACDTTPTPSALTLTRRNRLLRFTREVPPIRTTTDLDNP
jgi:hypothetical protein